MTLDLLQLTEKVKALAIEAGGFIREERNRFNRNAVEKKHAHDYVSYVDKESEKRIVTCLKELLPQAGFIAEEGHGNQFTDQPYCWLVDPLDGTTNFIHNNAPYCVSIALRNHEELLLGVVYEICRDECFWTYKGAPSYYKPTARRLVEKCYGNVTGLRLLGAAAAELCYVAAGRFEARIEALIGPWDIAAGTIILQNAGGTVTDFHGGDSFYSGREVLASNGKIHPFLLDIIEGK